jgi:hypothetical protein
MKALLLPKQNGLLVRQKKKDKAGCVQMLLLATLKTKV